MTPQDKYQKIMEVISDKTISEGCLIQIKWEYIFTIIDIDWDIATCYHPLKIIKTQRRAIEDISISNLDWKRNKGSEER